MGINSREERKDYELFWYYFNKDWSFYREDSRLLKILSPITRWEIIPLIDRWMANEEQKGAKNLWRANLELGSDYLRSAGWFCARATRRSIFQKFWEPILPTNEITFHKFPNQNSNQLYPSIIIPFVAFEPTLKISFHFNIFSPLAKSFRYFNFMEDPIALSWPKSVHRTHIETHR